MDRFLDNKFMKGLQKFGENLGKNSIFSAISKSMMGTMSVILVGSLFQILATIPTLLGWYTSDSQIYQILYTPYNMTMGIMSMFVVFMIGYNYSRSLKMKPIQNGIVALICFLAVVAPVTTVTLEGGSTLAVLDSSYLGATGLFVAILVGIFTVKVSHFCEKKEIVIKMPEVVPPFLSESFSAVIPLVFNLIIWYGIAVVLSIVTGGQMSLPLMINYVLSIPLAAVNSVPGMFVVGIFVMVLWVFGIHGSMVAYIALMPLMIQNLSTNAALVADGQDPIFHATFLFSAFACAGGTGNILPVVLMGLKSAKSEQIKAISKAGIIPALFNISEPVIFGFPIMYNPIMAIPFIIAPLVTMLLMWGGYVIGFFQPAYVVLMTLLPIGVGEFLGAMAWQNVLIPVLAIIVGFLVHYPFFRAYDRQLVEKEAAARAEAQAAA